MKRIGSLALGAILALAGCASQPRYPANESPALRGVAIEVTNHNWTDVVVYAVGAWSRVRLGSVATGSEQRFELPPSVHTVRGEFYLEARPVNSSEVFRSQTMSVTPGDRVIWSVENERLLSSFRGLVRA